MTAFNDSGHGRRKNPFVHEQVNVQRRERRIGPLGAVVRQN